MTTPAQYLAMVSPRPAAPQRLLLLPSTISSSRRLGPMVALFVES